VTETTDSGATATADASAAEPRYTGGRRQPPVGFRLRTLRTEAGLSMRALAALTRKFDANGTGLSLASICRLENDQHNPNPTSLDILAQALGSKLGRPVRPHHLSGEDNPRRALVNYLERERRRRRMDDQAFYGRVLGIDARTLDEFRVGKWLPNTEGLGSIMRQVPESVPLVVAAMQDAATTSPATG
jgi:transcriptional regulator with XRE-family HTH domain